MATKIAKQAMAGAHTAGIYADMSVDGPEIGTLVVVVDRAKNLPNRKTMGKQDPYCAARLGKEAKKTTTDRRGGQTPRWDQELRFTVHDSLDYHQLKVSVFNDDKKTDLIGETFVQLEEVLKPGGGQNDHWHNLNFKGRYAGEIRIELTFYDTRPRPNQSPKPSSSSSPAPSAMHQESTQEGVVGPRQQVKQLKRRPLPAEPTSSDNSPQRDSQPEQTLPPQQYTPSKTQAAPSSTSSYPPQSFEQSRVYDSNPALPPVYEMEPAPAGPIEMDGSDMYDIGPQFVESIGYADPRDELHLPGSVNPPASTTYTTMTPEHDTGNASQSQAYPPQPDQHHQPLHAQQQDSQYTNHSIELPELPPHTPRSNRSSAQPSPRYYSPANSSPTYTLPQYNTPEASLEPHRDASRYSGGAMPSPRPESYRGSPLRHRSTGDDELDQAGQFQRPAADSAPPPPIHRGSAGAFASPQVDASHPYGDVPAPLNVRQPRASTSQGQMVLVPSIEGSPEPHLTLAGMNHLASQSAPLVSYNDPYNQVPAEARHGSEPFLHQNHHPRPRGYSEQDSRPHSMNEFYMQPASRRSPQRSPQSQELRMIMDKRNIALRESPQPMQGATAYEQSFSLPSENQPPHANDQAFPHIYKPTAVHPDPRTPRRKTVGVAPGSGASDGSNLSSLPFSPDSFDQLNPNLSSAKRVNDKSPRYTTPEGIREAAFDREKEEKLEREGPILDSEGKVVDPSDHLPSSSWAPEPERKTPRKTHEIKLRFRNGAAPPLGAQPMPQGTPRPPRDYQGTQRPHSIATSFSPHTPPNVGHVGAPQFLHDGPHSAADHHHGSDAGSPTSRMRLQKRFGRPVSQALGPGQPASAGPATPAAVGGSVGVGHYHSSPILPPHAHSLSHGSPSPQHNVATPPSSSPAAAPQSSAHGTYPLRERPNYGHNAPPPPGSHHGSSPLYHHPRGSPLGNSAGSISLYSGPNAPPPVPAKVPLSAGQEEWGVSGMGSLSDEIGRIDIGTGSGRGRMAGSGGSPRYGYDVRDV